MRLFTGLDLPSPVTANLEDLLRSLRATAAIHWSPPANLHITTKFIGTFPEERLAELKLALAAIPKRPALSIRVRNLGFFPNARRPHSFWCGIEAPELALLAADTGQATAGLGVARESRPFSAHLTLARIKDRIHLARLHEAIASLKSTEFGGFEARSFFLYLSQLKPGGSVYTKLAEFPLQP